MATMVDNNQAKSGGNSGRSVGSDGNGGWIGIGVGDRGR